MFIVVVVFLSGLCIVSVISWDVKNTSYFSEPLYSLKLSLGRKLIKIHKKLKIMRKRKICI